MVSRMTALLAMALVLLFADRFCTTHIAEVGAPDRGHVLHSLRRACWVVARSVFWNVSFEEFVSSFESISCFWLLMNIEKSL